MSRSLLAGSLVCFLTLVFLLFMAPTQVLRLHTARQNTQSTSDQAQIEQWILDNGLNSYGDPTDTVYADGTPLFNAQTGQTVDRFKYIRSSHPDAPWRKQE